jgi:hypothetical protein
MSLRPLSAVVSSISLFVPFLFLASAFKFMILMLLDNIIYAMLIQGTLPSFRAFCKLSFFFRLLNVLGYPSLGEVRC